MRILTIHNYYLQPGGEDTVVHSEKKLLEGHGHTVELLSFDNADIRGALGKFAAFFSSIYNLKSYRLAGRRIREFRPDVVHIHNFCYVASPAVHRAAKALGVPVVQTLHNYRLICPSVTLMHKGRIYEDSITKVFPVRAIVRRVWKGSFGMTAGIVLMSGIHKLLGTWKNKVDAYIVLTEFTRDIFLKSTLGVSKDKFRIKPNFVEDHGCVTGERYGEFLYVGRLSEEKGIQHLLEAARTGGFQLRVIGDGPERPAVEACARENPNVSYDGPAVRDEVFEKLKQCRALIFPSLWYEGLPMVLLEALSTGTPVIATRLGNQGIVIKDGENGLLYTPGDAQDLARQVKRIQDDEALMEQVSAGARRSYDNDYTAEKNYPMLMSIYNSVLSPEMRGKETPE